MRKDVRAREMEAFFSELVNGDQKEEDSNLSGINGRGMLFGLAGKRWRICRSIGRQSPRSRLILE